MKAAHGAVVTERLRLVPIGSELAHGLWLVLSNPGVAQTYGTSPTLEEVERTAEVMAWAWRHHGLHKWLASFLGERARD